MIYSDQLAKKNPEAPSASEMRDAMNSLNRYIEELESGMIELGKSLSPILRSESPEIKKDKLIPNGGSEISNFIFGAGARLRNLGDKVQDLLGRSTL